MLVHNFYPFSHLLGTHILPGSQAISFFFFCPLTEINKQVAFTRAATGWFVARGLCMIAAGRVFARKCGICHGEQEKKHNKISKKLQISSYRNRKRLQRLITLKKKVHFARRGEHFLSRCRNACTLYNRPCQVNSCRASAFCAAYAGYWLASANGIGFGIGLTVYRGLPLHWSLLLYLPKVY